MAGMGTAALLRRVGTHLKCIHRGKVRDTFAIPGHPDLLLQVASDRISIFDFVLPAEVHGKGRILTATTVYWLTGILKNICPNHLVAYGTGIDTYLPVDLCGQIDLQSRALVVRKLRMLQVECVVRGYLTGSGWKSYQRTGAVCGHVLPSGLHDGSRLRVPLFTPTTKSHHGHDEDLDVSTADDRFGASLGAMAILIYEVAAQHAERKGIIIADTKFEFGVGQVLADEVLTPDASRFWLVSDWQEARKRKHSPQGFDKQYAREWGKTVQTPFVGTGGTPLTLNTLDPRNPEHRAFVSEITVPEEVLLKTSMLYQEVFSRLTGDTLMVYLTRAMGM